MLSSGYPFTAVPGIKAAVGEKPLDFFNLFFTPDVKEHIHTETCRYAQQQLEINEEYLQQHTHARAHEWKRNPMKLEEVNTFLSILIVIGVLGFPTLR